MRNKKYYIDLFNNINYNFSNFNSESFNQFLIDYLNFLDDEDNVKILSKIGDVVKIFLINKKFFFENFDIDEYHKVSLMSLILFKSLSKNSVSDSIYLINYSNSDFVLNEIITNYKNLNIFYHQKEPSHQEIHSIKGDVFKVIKYLILDSVIICKSHYYKNRTLEEWTFGKKNIMISNTENLKILNNKPKIINVNENFYCVGDFFLFVKKIFIENNKSEYFFKINDNNYIDNMSNLKLYLNLKDLEDVIKILNEDFIDIKNINLVIKNNNEKIETNLKNIYKNKKKIKKSILKLSKKNLYKILDNSNFEKHNIDANLENISNVLDITEIEKSYIKIFLNFSKKYIKKNSELVEINDENLYEILYSCFINKFENAYVKINIENLDDLLKLSTDFLEFSVNFDNEIERLKEKEIFDKTPNLSNYLNEAWSDNEYLSNEEFKTELSDNDIKKEVLKKKKNKKQLEIKKKIDPSSIPFILYLILYSKKEIEDILKKIIKSLEFNKDLNINKIDLNWASFINSNKKILNVDNYFKIGCCIFMKFGERDNIKIYKIIKEIERLNDLNKIIFAETSKISHVKDIYNLYEYLTTNEIFIKNLDEFNNIKFFFMFFFDFRGRFYYDSPISPTNNRFCRLIYNYGVVKKKNIEKNINRLSETIYKFTYIIEEVKKQFNITDDNEFIKESIFWVLISIGKIKIDKSKIEINLNEFFIIGKKLLNKEIILDDKLDLAEFNYYTKILENLKDENIIKRCLIKDATASFFQNLIRILGAKDEEAKKIANLNSEDTWYDWYTFILQSWKKNKNSTEFDYLFTRKTIKKVAMTFPYSATYMTCYEYFKDSVLENFKFNISKNEKITSEFKSFYNFIKDLMKTKGPFKESTESINIYFKKIIEKGEPIIIISENDDLTNLTYYKTTTKHFDFIIKWQDTTKRIIKNYIKINREKIDKRKTNSALKANLVHFVDALLIRDVNCEIYKIKKVYYLSVHDSFLVDFTEASDFILIVNQSFNKNVFKNEIWENEKNFFSIFIFL